MKIGWQYVVFGLILATSSINAENVCKKCNSAKDTNCLNDPSKITDTCKPAESCFTLIENDGSLTRGCVGENNIDCKGSNCKSCKATEAACNIETNLFWCKSCDSSSDPNCAYWKNENSIPSELCDSGITKCVKEIKSDKHTSRRCAKKTDETCSDDKTCNMCTDKNCNKDVFPSDRLKCFQCKSTESKCATPSKYTSDITSYPCLFYEPSDKCFEYGSETSMSRGCASDATSFQECSNQNPKEKCKECGTSGCNVDEFKITPTLKCIQCTETDSKCSGGYTAEDAKVCPTTIEYWKTQKCYSNNIGAGKVAKGCIQDFDCTATSTCTSCEADACNFADTTKPSCYNCRSDINPNCTNKLENDNYKVKPCRNQISSTDANAEQCYVENWNGIIIRSCLVDADPKTRKNCLDANYKKCETCKGDNCNTMKAPNSGHIIGLTSGLFLLSLLVLKIFEL